MLCEYNWTANQTREIPFAHQKSTSKQTTLPMMWGASDKEVKMLTFIATIIVWTIIQAVCAKNPGPLLLLIVLYAILSMVAEIMY